MTQGGAGGAVKKSSMGISVCLREGSLMAGYFPVGSWPNHCPSEV
jgi:hypothetical protein